MTGIPETRTLHDARRRGENLTLFDDRAGDFCGLDAFQQGAQGIAMAISTSSTRLR